LHNGEYRKGLHRNIYILSDSQAAIKALDSFQINSKLVCKCYQTLVKLAEHNTIQLVRVPGHMRFDINEMADELDRQCSSHLPRGPEPLQLAYLKRLPGV